MLMVKKYGLVFEENREKIDFIYNDSFVDATDGIRHNKWIYFFKLLCDIIFGK